MSNHDTSYENGDRIGRGQFTHPSNNWPLSEAVSGKVWVLLGSQRHGCDTLLGVFTSQAAAAKEEEARQSRDDDYDFYTIEEWELNQPAGPRQWWKHMEETE